MFVPLPPSACALQPQVLPRPYVVFKPAHSTPHLPLNFCLLHLYPVPRCSHPCGGQLPLTLPLTVSPLCLPLALLKCVFLFPLKKLPYLEMLLFPC